MPHRRKFSAFVKRVLDEKKRIEKSDDENLTRESQSQGAATSEDTGPEAEQSRKQDQ